MHRPSFVNVMGLGAAIAAALSSGAYAAIPGASPRRPREFIALPLARGPRYTARANRRPQKRPRKPLKRGKTAAALRRYGCSRC